MPRVAALLFVATAACGADGPAFVDDSNDPACDAVSCPAVCGDGACDLGESCSTCSPDCGACAAPRCGDGTCDGGESCARCAADCGECAAPPCGDGVCDAAESCATCAADCGACVVCGDGACSGDESCSSCAADCGACVGCGDGTCAAGETCSSCGADCGVCDVLFAGTVCAPMARDFPALAAGSREAMVLAAATMGRDAFAARWAAGPDEADMYAVMTWTLNTLRQNGHVVFRALVAGSTPEAPQYEADKLVIRDAAGDATFDLFTSWQTTGTPQALAFAALAPAETGDLLDCAGGADGIATNTIFPGGGGTVPTDLSAADRANLLAAATYVRNNFPQFFGVDDRAVAYDMMTVVINDARARGTDAMRCLAHTDRPPTDPYRWCSDALVVGQPGLGITVDMFTAWPDPATPQVLITGTGTTGEMTSDLMQ